MEGYHQGYGRGSIPRSRDVLMPTYTIEISPGVIEELNLPYDDYQKLMEEHPEYKRVWDASALIVTGVNHKPDNTFRDILKTIKKNNRRSNINVF